MYALTYKKQNLLLTLYSLCLKHKWKTLCLAVAIYQFSGGMYIYAKAELAQFLIGNAWHKNLNSDQHHKPWPWADTYPIGELVIKDSNWYVLAGASGRNLAFAPAHVSSTAQPGEAGNSVIVGHRDTQFNRLKSLKRGDIIEVRSIDKHTQYKVSTLRIADQSQLEYMQSTNGTEFNDEQSVLTLITCYPFDSVLPNPTHRFIVRAEAI